MPFPVLSYSFRLRAVPQKRRKLECEEIQLDGPQSNNDSTIIVEDEETDKKELENSDSKAEAISILSPAKKKTARKMMRSKTTTGVTSEPAPVDVQEDAVSWVTFILRLAVVVVLLQFLFLSVTKLPNWRHEPIALQSR